MAYVRNLDTTTAGTFWVSYCLFCKVLLTSGLMSSNINRSLQVWEDEIFNIGTRNVTKSEGQQVGVFCERMPGERAIAILLQYEWHIYYIIGN